MNYLAHIALSGSNPEIIMGNFSGDFIKGRLDSPTKVSLPKNFIAGVRLHRFIDNFTDTDETVREMTKELCHTYGRAAAIATDIYFDHFLAKDFSKYHGVDLRSFVSGFYDISTHHSHLIVPAFRPLAEALISNDWLFRYREWITVERTLISMGKRYPFLAELLNSSNETKRNLLVYEEYFVDFYPRLQNAVALKLIVPAENSSQTKGNVF